MLDRLNPKNRGVVVCPQIRFPDCYGIDMSRMGDFVAFRAMIQLIKRTGEGLSAGEVYEQCLQSENEKQPTKLREKALRPVYL